MAVQFAPRPNENRSAMFPMPKWQPVWSVRRISILATLVIFLIYGTFRAAENRFYSTEHVPTDRSVVAGDWEIDAPHYLSPFYSPPLQDWGVKLPFGVSVAFVLLVVPGSFRASCYFCRRTYYRNVFGTPPACAAREVLRHATKATKYTGEKEFPLWMNNLHRMALYAVLVYVAFHWLHFVQAFRFGSYIGIGVGTVILALDAVFLTLYVVSCHSFRHLIGGIVNKFSNAPGRHALWRKVTALNENHGLYFWLSLLSVGLTDVYIRAICAGVLNDWHLVFGRK